MQPRDATGDELASRLEQLSRAPESADSEDAAWEVSRLARESVSPLTRMETQLHPWSAYVILPIFALANAGVPGSGRIETFSIEEIDRAIDVNLRAPVVLARRLAEGMAARGGGHIVFISSLNGKAAPPGTPIYAATKFGLRGFAQSLRQDLRPQGVGVSTSLSILAEAYCIWSVEVGGPVGLDEGVQPPVEPPRAHLRVDLVPHLPRRDVRKLVQPAVIDFRFCRWTVGCFVRVTGVEVARIAHSHAACLRIAQIVPENRQGTLARRPQ